MSIFGETLKRLRKNAGYTQKELAQRLWLSKNSISYYERATRFPSPDVLVNIAEVFHVTTDYLLGRDKKKRIIDVTDLPEGDIEFLSSVIQFLRNKNQPSNKPQEQKIFTSNKG